jgi:hypothetical protein
VAAILPFLSAKISIRRVGVELFLLTGPREDL